jgi:chlorobactene glucosyltransferase
MLYQIIVTVGLVIFTINLILNLKTLKRPKSGIKVAEPAPLVSVLIPARNEEENIEACLHSLQKQDYPNFEILVLDDNSVDNTASLIAEIATEDERVRLIRGVPLAGGWAGKPFACFQLAKQAKGSWLLFVDADTIHAPNMLSGVLDLALRLNPSLLSGFPHQLANSLPQKIAIPVLYFVILSWLPLWWLQLSKKPKPSLAIGQFLLFPKEEYWKIGGHETVKSKILEDVWLGIEIIRNGGRHIAIDLSPVVSCNMYNNLRSMWEGFIKWMYSVASLFPAILVILLVIGYVFYLAPFYWLWNEFFVVTTATEWRTMVVLQVILVILMRWLIDNHFKEPAVSAFLHPIGFTYLYLAVLYGSARHIIGKGVQWKDRLYSDDTGVD